MSRELVFDSRYDFPRRQPAKRYLILCSPRSGSNMLADGLHQTGLAGFPLEYLNQRVLGSLPAPLTFEKVFAYLDEVSLRRTSPNGIFGVKIHYHQFARLFVTRNAVNPFGRRFLSLFSDAILLNRRDKVGQALSYVIALETEQWHSFDPADAHSSKIALDGDGAIKVAEKIAFLLRETQAWRRLIGETKLNVTEVFYEDLVREYRSEMGRVLAFLGLPDVRLEPRSVKLAGTDSLEARATFLTMLGIREAH